MDFQWDGCDVENVVDYSSYDEVHKMNSLKMKKQIRIGR